MGHVLQVLPRTRLTVCVAFPTAHDSEVVVEDLPTGQPLFRATSRGGEPRVWHVTNDGNEPMMYRLVARHKVAHASAEPAWVLSADKLLFSDPVTHVIGYEDGGDEDFRDTLATVVWH